MHGALVLASTADYVLGSAGSVVFCAWRGHVTISAVQALQQACASTLLHHPHFGLITTAEPESPLPESAARRFMSQAMGAQTGLVGLAFVVEGTGFRAAAVRSVTVGLSLLAQPPFPLRIVRSVALATEWIGQQLASVGVSVSPTLPADLAAIRSCALRA